MSTEELPVLSSPLEGRWIAKPSKPRWGVAKLAFSGLAIYISMRVMDVGIDAKDDTMALIGLSVFVILVTIIATAKVSEFVARHGKPSGTAVADATFGDQFAVEIHLLVHGKQLGRDRGVLWFGDGLMGFSGHALSFVLAAADIAPQWEKLLRKNTKKSLPADAVVLRNAPKDAYFVVTPLAGRTKAYRKRLYEFKKENAEPAGERHWPPLHRYLVDESSSEPVVRR
jgi:hypothetical protein